MLRCKTRPYEGDQPYIFVSYPHRDKEMVFPVIEHLSDEGYRVWYDEGIDPGAEWATDIANHLAKSSAVIMFLSKSFLESHHCRDELHFARSKAKTVLTIYLEPTEIDVGMELMLASYQAIFKCSYDNEADFYEKLFGATCLKPCCSQLVAQRREVGENAAPESAAATGDVKETVGQNQPSRSASKRQGRILYSGQSGTCRWEIDESGALTVSPINGTEGMLKKADSSVRGIGYVGGSLTAYPPWIEHAGEVTSASFQGKIVLNDNIALFLDHEHMEECDLEGLDTHRVDCLAAMFMHCRSLRAVDVSMLDTANVTSLDEMFNACRALESVEIPPRQNLMKARTLKGMFRGCVALSWVDLRAIHLTVATSTDDMFFGCERLEVVYSEEKSKVFFDKLVEPSARQYPFGGLERVSLCAVSSDPILQIHTVLSRQLELARRAKSLSLCAR